MDESQVCSCQMNGIAFLRRGGVSERWGVHLERILQLLTCAWKVCYSDLG